MIRLTDQQCQELSGENNFPPRALNPQTNAEFVLVRAELYEKIKALFEDVPITEDEETVLLREAGMYAGWDDPEMDIYNDMVPRQP
jgi:hypothetical protein